MGQVTHLRAIGMDEYPALFLGDILEDAFELAGTTQGTAAAIVSTVTRISNGVAGSEGGILPALNTVKNFPYFVHNQSAITANIYPASGENFNSSAADLPLGIAAGDWAIFVPSSSTRWLAFFP